MKGKLFEMHADKVSCKLLSVIKAKKELDTKEKEAYKECVKNALIQEFKKPYISTIRSQFNIRNIHKYFYTLSRENKLTAEERDVSIIIAVTLFQKNPNFISANGDVSLEGRQYLQYILQKSLQDTTPSGSKSVSNILHDGDFHFLHHTVTDNVPLLTHFTQFILYLMDEKCFNPYDKHPNGRSKEKREKAKNGLLNDIYMLIINEDAFIPKTVHIEKPENYSDTMHKNTVHLLEPNIIALNKSNKENPKYT
ncbi:MAG: hypothetical protein LBG59_08435 [Candidatus Peribacteria bacterium]|jgi:hypothetical protein|nr:hypothetical protein [Candidatus Peribacteria bacterium]